MQEPRQPNLRAVFHVISYLKGTSDWGLFYPAVSVITVTAFCDGLVYMCIQWEVSHRLLHISWEELGFMEDQEAKDNIQIFS